MKLLFVPLLFAFFCLIPWLVAGEGRAGPIAKWLFWTNLTIFCLLFGSFVLTEGGVFNSNGDR